MNKKMKIVKKIGLILGIVLLAAVINFINISTGSQKAIAQLTVTKLCSVFIPSEFRDTFPVPSGWNAGTCQNFQITVRADNYQLACAFNNSFSFGTPNGGTPSPNCGW